MSRAVELWNAWQRFPDWWKTHWNLDWDTEVYNMSDSEWTSGVILPFIVTSVAPTLGCQARLELERIDVTLVKELEGFPNSERRA